MTNQIVLQFSTTPWHVVRDPRFTRCYRTFRLRQLNYASWLIRKFNHSPFSHVDMVLPDLTLLGASDQGPTSPCITGNPEGVAIRPYDYQPFGYRRQMIIKTDKAGAIMDAALSQLGKPFDKSGLLEFLSDKFPGHRDWRLTNRWKCSELGLWSFETGGYWMNPPIPWPKNRCSPTDLLLLFITDPNFINADIFWDPIPGLRLEAWET